MLFNKKPDTFFGNNIAAACFIIQLTCIGTIFSFGIFLREFQMEFGWSRAAISGASSLNFLLTGLGGIYAGRLNDRIGPKLIIMATGLLLGIGYILMSQIESIWQLYLFYGVIIGVGISSVDVITLSTIARWFMRRRGAVSGIVKVGTGTGQLVVPVLLAILISSIGWRDSYIVISIATVLNLLIIAQVMRRDPAEMGLLPDGEKSVAKKTELEQVDLSMKTAFRTKQLWILCLVLFCIFFCLISVIVHIYAHARDTGLSAAVAASILSISGGASISGRLLMGFLNDRMGGKNSLIICFLILICSLSVLQLANTAWLFFVFAGIYGIAHGGIFTVISPVVAEYFGLISHGVLLGVVYFIGTIGGAIGPFLTGRLFDVTGSYQTAFYIMIGMASTGLILILQLKPVKH